MANDVDRQTKTDEIVAALQALKDLADEATAMDMKAQIKVDGNNFVLANIVPADLRTYLDKTFEATP